jgi:hypothetical protein
MTCQDNVGDISLRLSILGKRSGNPAVLPRRTD